jgi:hypothetical protein
MPNAGNAAALIGLMIFSHCAFERLVAISGYSSDFITQNCSENQASAREKHLVRTLSAHLTAFSKSACVCAV